VAADSFTRVKSVGLGQAGSDLSFEPAFRPNSRKATLKILGQKNWALQAILFNFLSFIIILIIIKKNMRNLYILKI